MRAVTPLAGMVGDAAAARHALIRRKLGVTLNVAHQQVERMLRVGLDELQLGVLEAGAVLVELDVIAILNFIATVLRAVIILALIILTLAPMLAHRFRVDPRM